jgi:hypothetical protein
LSRCTHTTEEVAGRQKADRQTQPQIEVIREDGSEDSTHDRGDECDSTRRYPIPSNFAFQEVLPEVKRPDSAWVSGAKVMFYLYSKNLVLSPTRRFRRQILRREVTIAIPSLHTRTRERSS